MFELLIEWSLLLFWVNFGFFIHLYMHVGYSHRHSIVHLVFHWSLAVSMLKLLKLLISNCWIEETLRFSIVGIPLISFHFQGLTNWKNIECIRMCFLWFTFLKCKQVWSGKPMKENLNWHLKHLQTYWKMHSSRIFSL